MVRVILTGAEANRAYERAILGARHEIWAAFRRIDPDFLVTTEEASVLGPDWGSLITATLKRGVSMTLFLADFDPLACSEAHHDAHAARRRLMARAEEVGAADRLRIEVVCHPLRAGPWLRRAAVRPRSEGLAAELDRLAALSPEDRAARLADMPGLATHLAGLAGTRPRLRPLARPPIAGARHNHQLLVADRKVLIIGGPTLDPDAGDDGLRLMREGSSATDAQSHLENFAEIVAGRADPGTHRHLLRTLSAPGRMNRARRLDLRQDLRNAHLALARRAEDLIVIETGALTDPQMAEALAAAGQAQPDLGLIVLLPARQAAIAAARAACMMPPDFAAQDTALAGLARAFGPRFFAAEMLRPLGPGAQRLALFDRRAALVGSADLTPAAMERDTEAGLYIRTPREVGEIGQRVMAYWLNQTRTLAPMGGPGTVATWRTLAEAGNGRMRPYPLSAASSASGG